MRLSIRLSCYLRVGGFGNDAVQIGGGVLDRVEGGLLGVGVLRVDVGIGPYNCRSGGLRTVWVVSLSWQSGPLWICR